MIISQKVYQIFTRSSVLSLEARSVGVKRSPTGMSETINRNETRSTAIIFLLVIKQATTATMRAGIAALVVVVRVVKIRILAGSRLISLYVFKPLKLYMFNVRRRANIVRTLMKLEGISQGIMYPNLTAKGLPRMT